MQLMTSPSSVMHVEPRWRTGPAQVSSAGREAVDLAESAGLLLDPWQAAILDGALGEKPDGKWAAREVGLICPRQNGKGSILEAVELAGLFLFGEQLILHSAHEFKTAAEAYLRVRALIQNTPDLHRRVKPNGYHNAHGSEGIELTNGARLRFVARTGGSGRGFSGDRIILDEAYNLSDRGVSALFPTMAARPNPQIWYTSSAPLEDSGSDVLRRLCKRGREGSKSLAYFEYCSDPDLDPVDPEGWRQANPAFPHRISPETIELEQAAMLPEDFDRERRGIWVDPLADDQWVIPAELWFAGASDTSGIEGPVSFALEVAEDRTWSCIASAGQSTDGEFTHIEVVDYREGTPWTIGRCLELTSNHGGQIAVARSSPAASLIPQLLAAQVPVVEVSAEDHAKACGQLFDGVINGQIRHPHQAHLDVALKGAVKKDSGDAWVWSRRKSTTDISPLVAATLAAGQHALHIPADIANEIW